jgi:hypothetical protein
MGWYCQLNISTEVQFSHTFFACVRQEQPSFVTRLMWIQGRGKQQANDQPSYTKCPDRHTQTQDTPP